MSGLKSWSAILVLAIWGVLMVVTGGLPAAAPEIVPSTEFSAGRAMKDVAAMAQAPHPTGSVEACKVRDYLTARLRDLGFEVAIQKGVAAEQFPTPSGPLVSGGVVENIIARMPGENPELKAVALMAHYDSVAGSPGAADDAAGVAAAIEVAQNIAAEGRPLRDLFLILTDGEEIGLVGARAFFADQPLAERIGFVVNLEARGSTGPAVMFETSLPSDAFIRVYGDTVKSPRANSLWADVYRRMPNGTDLTVPLNAGIEGANIAFLGRQFDYHSMSATPENLDERSLQQMGEQALAIASHFANEKEWARGEGNLVYFDVLGMKLVAYPIYVGWLVLIAAIVIAGAACARLWRVGEITALSSLRAIAEALAVMLALMVVLHFFFRILGGTDPMGAGRNQLLAQFEFFAASAVASAVAAGLTYFALPHKLRLRAMLAGAILATGAACSLVGGVDIIGGAAAGLSAVLLLLLGWGAVSRPARWIGLIFIGAAATLALQLIVPGGAYLFAWPLLASAIAGFLSTLRAPGPLKALAVIALVTIPILQAPHFGSEFFDAVGFGLPEIAAPFFLSALIPFSALMLVLPIAATPARIGASVALIVSVGLAGFVGLHKPSRERFPESVQFNKIVDEDGARYFSALSTLSPWTRDMMGGDAVKIGKEPLPALFLPEAWTSPAQADEPRPLQTETSKGEDGWTRLRIIPRAEAELRVTLHNLKPDASIRIEHTSLSLMENDAGVVRIYWRGGPLDLNISPEAERDFDALVAELVPMETEAPPPGSVFWGNSPISAQVTRLRLQ